MIGREGMKINGIHAFTKKIFVVSVVIKITKVIEMPIKTWGMATSFS